MSPFDQLSEAYRSVKPGNIITYMVDDSDPSAAIKSVLQFVVKVGPVIIIWADKIARIDRKMAYILAKSWEIEDGHDVLPHVYKNIVSDRAGYVLRSFEECQFAAM